MFFYKNGQNTSETFTADFVGTEETKLEDIEALDLVTDLASLANLLSPATKIQMASLLKTWSPPRPFTANILRLVLNGLFEGGDVPEGAEEEDHHVSLILDGGDVHQQPERGPWEVTNVRTP